MTNKSLAGFAVLLAVLTSCTWSNTVWLNTPAQQKPTSTLKLLDPTMRPAKLPDALVEAKGFKTWDSRGDMLNANVENAKQIGAKEMWCPSETGTVQGYGALVIPKKEDIGLLKELLIAITDLIKAIVALPVTARSEAISAKTLLCAVYWN